MSERQLLTRFGAPLALFVVIALSVIVAIETLKSGLTVIAFWPGNGIAIVALLRLRRPGQRLLVGVAIVAALFLANMVCGMGVRLSLQFTAASIAEITCAYMILRTRPPDVGMERRRLINLLPAGLLAALLAPTLSASIATWQLPLPDASAPWSPWMQWWLPAVLGILIVVPFGLFVSKEDFAKLREPRAAIHALIGALVLGAALWCIVLTGLLLPLMAVAPLIVLAAVRFRTLGAAVTIAASAWVIIPLAGDNEAMRLSAVPDAMPRVAMVQAFLALTALLALAVSAFLDERDALLRALEGRRRTAADAASGRLRLLMNVAHEIRTPLNVIQGCGELAGAAGPLNARQKDLLDAVTGAARQLQVLANDLLETARLEHGAVALNPERIMHAELIETAVADVRASLSWTGPVLISHACETMWADPQRFRQVATNLISNAAKFGGAYGPIRISTKEVGDAVVLSVCDCGPGFPSGREHEIFEPFASSSGQVTPASAGVGLSLVKQLVEAHGGAVRSVSTPFIETRIEAAFPGEHAPGAAAQRASVAQVQSIDPDSVF